MDDFLLSVIIPVHNEQDNIAPLLERLLPAVKGFDHEIIFVDDGSTDSTAKNIKKEAGRNKKIKLVSFYRNFGHQMALAAGYDHCKGDCAITIDADLQDPPEIIPEMVEKWRKGAKIVYARRSERKVDSFFKKATAEAFYRVINFLSDTPIPLQVGDFRLIDRTVIDFLGSLKEKPSFLRGLVSWAGFPTEYVYHKRENRNAGETNYGIIKMANFALDGIISFSVKPLRMAVYFGLFSGTLGFTGIVYTLVRKILYPELYVVGWTGIFVSVMFLGGIQLITIGIIGEYIGKIYQEIQGRPRYLVREKTNI